MKKKLLTIFCIALVSATGFSQMSLTNFLKAGTEDAELLFGAYFEPYGMALGTNLNGGWVNTASAHKTLGFDITLTTTTSFIPTGDQTFDVSALNLTKFTLSDPADNMAPTAAGYDSNGPVLTYSESYSGGQVQIASISTPPGSGYAFLPLPMIKAAVGLPLNFELMGRYMPTLKVIPDKDFEIGQWGIGLKHDLKQYIPFIKRVPVLNLSVMGAYSQLKTTAGLNLQPYGNPYDETTDQVTTVSGFFDNQEFEMIATGFTGNLLFSANLPVICFYGGIGFSSTTTSIRLLGDYPITGFDLDPSYASHDYKVLKDDDIVTDPIDIEINGNDGIRYMVGARLKLALLTLHVDYTYANYHVASAGIGISFR
jgi:hypothetical protein